MNINHVQYYYNLINYYYRVSLNHIESNPIIIVANIIEYIVESHWIFIEFSYNSYRILSIVKTRVSRRSISQRPKTHTHTQTHTLSPCLVDVNKISSRTSRTLRSGKFLEKKRNQRRKERKKGKLARLVRNSKGLTSNRATKARADDGQTRAAFRARRPQFFVRWTRPHGQKQFAFSRPLIPQPCDSDAGWLVLEIFSSRYESKHVPDYRALSV